ncbi:hypothetical protein [Bauldia litoralis]|uniref:hypothetical protein n=1 Tax=Bauldia litoralis TaxID=665467 RepID=UPI003265F74E
MRHLIADFARWRAERCLSLADETDDADEMMALLARSGWWARVDLLFSGLTANTTWARRS